MLGTLAGTSARLLLLAETEDDPKKAKTVQRRTDGRQANAFDSLSPITFQNASDLHATMKNIFKNSNTPPRNRPYGLNYDAMYEHSRVIYKCLAGQAIPPGCPSLKSPHPRIISLAVTEWNADTRLPNDRHKDPRLLQIGWSEADTSLRPIPGTARHFDVLENKNLGQPALSRDGYNPKPLKPEPFKHGEHGSPKLSRDVVEQLKEFIRSPSGSGRTTLLVVHNTEKGSPVNGRPYRDVAETLFERAELPFRWQKDLKDLFDYPSSTSPDAPSIKSNTNDPRSRERREERTGPTPIYIVDVHQLYKTASGRGNHLQTVKEVADAMNLLNEGSMETYDAGNDAVLLFDIFRTLASGPSVFTSSRLWGSNIPPSQPLPSQPPVSIQTTGPAVDSDDEEEDINAVLKEPPTAVKDHYDFSDDDSDEY